VLKLRFQRGTLHLEGDLPSGHELPVAKDPRTGGHRAEARRYAELVLALKAAGLEVEDEARAFDRRDARATLEHEPRDYQRAAVEAWQQQRGRGLVVLPTGSGKTTTALLAMDAFPRDTLVVAPTLDLVQQWHGVLSRAYEDEIGLIGGGSHEVRSITVSTYDSAHLHMEHLGARFGMVIFDEAHHLPAPGYSLVAEMSLAPFRLGLTATPERLDGRDALFERLIGPTAYRRDIDEMAGTWLAPYDTVTVEVALTDEERARYEETRAVYLAFLRNNGIRMGSPRGFSDFLMRAAGSDEGHEALACYREQRALARAATRKLEETRRILWEHRDEAAIVFTDDNKTAYAFSRELLIPCITHQTKVKERAEILSGLREGRYHAVVTSRVLNEGVDVPEASIAVVVSGTGSVREHVQRLGRVLRKHDDRRALLYELVSSGTNETGTSERRRDHVAYR
jgi:superfamily II DNA or RNA helicase